MREWTPLENFLWKVKWNINKFFWVLRTHKCEASGCDRRLEGKYRWCSLECYAYCGGKLKYERPT